MDPSSTVSMAFTTAIAAVLWMVAVSTSAVAPQTADEAAAYRDQLPDDVRRDFQRRLDAYLDLRASLQRALAPPTTTADPAAIEAWQKALASALRGARRAARPGDVITPAVATVIRESVAHDFGQRSPDAESAALSEVPDARPRVNAVYPDDEARPPVPPVLLEHLPRLPEALQFRFYGRHLILLDSDTELIVDFVPDVVPRTRR